MRKALAHARGRRDQPLTAHPGLLYERYAPVLYRDSSRDPADKSELKIGTLRPKDQEHLLRDVAGIPVSPVYRAAWRRWYAAVQSSQAIFRIVEASSRVLIGHGNPAPSEVGITLHQVYGVPMLPGSALKGLLNHYLAAWGGDADERWRGVEYDEQTGRPKTAPGVWHGAIFGIPELPCDDTELAIGQRGGLVFEDAWLIPDDRQAPLCTDVLTPHQVDYYRNFGLSPTNAPNRDSPPDDWSEPTPVSFLTVPPRTRFLLAISPLQQDRKAAELAMHHLVDALDRLGIGAKTRAGYGRFRLAEQGSESTADAGVNTPAADVPLSEVLRRVQEAVDAVLTPPDRDAAPPIVKRLETFITDALLAEIPAHERAAAARILARLESHPGLRKRRKERLAEIMEEVGQ
jgi:CRISPR-associated protein Cmr6